MRLLVVGAFIALIGLSCAEQKDQIGSNASRGYVINGGEVYDKINDLTWQRCFVGQHWVDESGGACVGYPKLLTSEDAQKVDKGIWRIPTEGELPGIKSIDALGRVFIDDAVFPGAQFEHRVNHLKYWVISDVGFMRLDFFLSGDVFGHAGINYDDSGGRAALRLVRNGKRYRWFVPQW
jgi:hypothetical protein